MKINIITGFFLPVPPVAGGATEKIWHRLAQEFVAAGHSVTFVSRCWPGFPNQETLGGVSHLRLPGADHTRSLPLNLWHDFWWGVRVARKLPRADVTICNAVTLPAWLGRFRTRAGLVIAVVARMPKGHGWAYGRVDGFFSLSNAVTAKLVAENTTLAGRIMPFPYPIDWALHANAGKTRTGHRTLTIGYVGRIHPEKGIDLLAEAIALLARRDNLPPWRLEIVGPWTVAQGGGGESYRDDLIARFRGAIGERVTFREPEFDPGKLARRYAAMDIFCYPSLADQGETFGVAIAEAMAAGCAPIVSDLACFNELIRSGENGLVFDRRGPAAGHRLADAFAALLTDAPLRCALATKAQAHAQRFDYAQIAGIVLADLGRLVATRTPA